MRKRRTLLAILGGIMVFALVVGMAASLGGISSQSLGADDAVVAACDTNGIATSYTSSYSTTGTAGYKVGNVTVAGIADACDGATMAVTLTGSGGTSLGDATATVDVDSGASDTSDVVNMSSANALVENVTGVHVVISG